MESTEALMDGFVEGLFLMVLEHHQSQVGEADLTLVQAQTLSLLRAGPLPASKLAAALGISAPAMTQLTDRLGRKNLIERQNVKGDRRAVMVALTEKGGQLIDGFRRRRNEVFAGALSRLDEDTREEVIAALSKMAAALRGREQPLPSSIRPKALRPKRQAERRTAVEPPEASKVVGEVPVTLPARRRMRIEWD
jgi:DNA-binding MarR family transcriptional regulator